ncbi:MAG: TIM barrel protein [Egibacteraceae bacterium]
MSTPEFTEDLEQQGGSPVGVVPLLWDLTQARPETVLGEISDLGLLGVQWQEPFAGRTAEYGLWVAEVYAAVECDADGPSPEAPDALRRRLERLDELDGDVLVVACDGASVRDGWAGRAQSAETPRLTVRGWRRLAAVVDGIADQARSLGRTVAFHAHAGTWVESPEELAGLLEVTDPESVGVCLDTGHHLVGGADPVADIAAYGRRITHVHLKDVVGSVLAALVEGEVSGFQEAVERRVFCPLGQGVLDLPGVLRGLHDLGYDGWLMLEQDSAWQPATEAVAASLSALTAALRELSWRNPLESGAPRQTL